MKFRKKFRGQLLWLTLLGVFFSLYYTLRQSRTAMNRLCGHVLLPAAQWMGRLCGHLSVSVAEVIIITGICVVFFWMVNLIRKLIAQPSRRDTLLRFGLTLSAAGLTVYALFCLMWGTFYNTDSFQERSGLTARGGTVQELTALAERFAGYVNETYAKVPRYGSYGIAVLDRNSVLDRVDDAYENLYEEYPFLEADVGTPKAFVSSRAMSAMDFTGFYFPFTGEANLNVDAPSFYLPATACHERGHQLGIASEQECNFLGILAALRSDDGDFRYAGALMGYVYVSNALYRVDRDAWQVIHDSLPQEVLNDLAYQRAYWARYETPVRTVATKVYDGFLKANGDDLGVLSYGTVVDLLLAYDWK